MQSLSLFLLFVQDNRPYLYNVLVNDRPRHAKGSVVDAYLMKITPEVFFKIQHVMQIIQTSVHQSHCLHLFSLLCLKVTEILRKACTFASVPSLLISLTTLAGHFVSQGIHKRDLMSLALTLGLRDEPNENRILGWLADTRYKNFLLPESMSLAGAIHMIDKAIRDRDFSPKACNPNFQGIKGS